MTISGRKPIFSDARLSQQMLSVAVRPLLPPLEPILRPKHILRKCSDGPSPSPFSYFNMGKSNCEESCTAKSNNRETHDFDVQPLIFLLTDFLKMCFDRISKGSRGWSVVLNGSENPPPSPRLQIQIGLVVLRQPGRQVEELFAWVSM